MQIVPRFTDVLKVCDGRFCAAELHAARIGATIRHFYGKQAAIDFNDAAIPDHLRTGVVKCRVVYTDEILSMEFSPYVFRRIDSMAVVADDTIEYAYKYADRSCFTRLQAQQGDYDELLIVKNGLVTDTSYSNVVFEDSAGELFTPSSTLLPGLKRRQLLEQGRIRERVIRSSDIGHYRRLYLINAMIDPEDNISVDCSRIYH